MIPRLCLLLGLLAPLGCQAFQEPLKDPATIQLLEGIALSAAEKSVLATAAKFQVTDESAIKNLVTQAQTAASSSVQAAVTRIDAKTKEERKAWREETRAQIAASLQGVGGALAVTGNPILMGLGLLMGIGGILTSPKKKEEKAP